MKNYIVPQGMLQAAKDASDGIDPEGYFLHGPMVAAIKWLSNNPIRPTVDQVKDIGRILAKDKDKYETSSDFAVEWQRRMFLAPEPKVPQAIKDLYVHGLHDFKAAILEAYNRGRNSK
jgi:hypothetical protein